MRLRLLLPACLALWPVGKTTACTWFDFVNDQGNCFVGRTMEWPTDLHAEIALVPRNYELGSFKTKYGFVGMSHGGLFSDGLNETGLAASALWLDSSKYPDKTEGSRHISELLGYVLGNTKSVEEALAYIKGNTFHTGPVAATGKLALALHFAITQPDGRSVVVEFVDGKTVIHENKVGVMTNDPPYEEQLRGWAKYDSSKLNEDSFEAFNYSPEGRFCRMAAINATQTKVPDDLAAVNRAWSMINTVDIPQGILYWRWVSDHPQFTSYAVVDDLRNRIFYFRTYDNYDIRKVDLGKIDFATAKYRANSLFGKADYKEYKFE